jgi:NADH-quinone oxidoreductase chain G
MIKVFVDGSEVLVEEGATVLQACEVLGLDLPRFCYHEGLSIAGNCRMCLVEILKTPKPVASCAMPVMEGMQIFTNSPLVKKAREGVLEFLLLNHPLDCPICDQGGECDLQDQAMAFGSDSSRYFEAKRGVENKNCGPLIKTVMNRCIHCTRCVRFATEVAGVGDLGVTGRGRKTEIGTYIEKALKSELSGNVIDLCPVGALTSKPYAFLSRPWEVESRESLDLSDSLGSNLLIQSRATEILRVLPRYHSERNEDWITDRARFSYDGLRYQRLDRPYLKEGQRLRLCSWEEALNKASEAVQSVDGSKLQAIIGESVDTFTALQLKRGFEALGSSHIYREGKTKNLNLDSPKNYSLWSSLEGVEKFDLCLLVGMDPRYEASLLNLRLRKSVLEGKLQVANIGAPLDLTFPCKHLGSTMTTLGGLAEGKNDFNRDLARAKNPLLLVGGAFSSWGGEALTGLLQRLPMTIAYLPQGGNAVGLMEMGIQEGTAPQGVEVTYLLAADERPAGEGFLIYQGHHGETNASLADIVLPGAAFTEKGGLYMNAEGRPQSVDPLLSSPGESRVDWMILRDIFSGTLFSEEEFLWWSQEIMGWSVEDKGLLSKETTFSIYTFGKYAPLRGILPGDLQEGPSLKTKKATLPLDRKPLRSSVLDFYQTTTITRASPLMAKCSSLYRKVSNFKD